MATGRGLSQLAGLCKALWHARFNLMAGHQGPVAPVTVLRNSILAVPSLAPGVAGLRCLPQAAGSLRPQSRTAAVTYN